MATDAATLTILLQSAGTGGAAPPYTGTPPPQPGTGGPPPGPAPSQPFDPYSAAHARKQAEDRRKEVDDAYKAMYPDAPFNPAEAAKKQFEAEQRQKAIKASYESTYGQPKSMFDQLFKPSSPETRQSSAFASMGLGMAGMHSAAGVVGGYAAMGPAGAVLAAVQIAMQKLSEGITGVFKMAAAVGSLDPDKMSRGLADMAEKIPIVGMLLGPLAHGILDLSDSVMQTAKRLAEYSGPLAAQQAMIEIRHLQRDIERAQTFGPQIMQAVEARYQFEEKIQDFLNENFPLILQMMEDGLGLLKDNLPTMIELLQLLKDGMPAMVNLSKLLVITNPVYWFTQIVKFLKQTSENTQPEVPPGDVGLENNLANLEASLNSAFGRA